MNHEQNLTQVIIEAEHFMRKHNLEFLTPEVVFLSILQELPMYCTMVMLSIDMRAFLSALRDWVKCQEKVEQNDSDHPDPSSQMFQVAEEATMMAINDGAKKVGVPHYVRSMFHLQDSTIAYLLQKYIGEKEENFLHVLTVLYKLEPLCLEEVEAPADEPAPADEEYDPYDVDMEMGGEEYCPKREETPWQQLVTCITDHVDEHNPLIGREKELERTIQVLCRKDKNNPLHVGEPGVGKTSLIYGLAKRIQQKQVPERLLGKRIYSLEIGQLMAGTQYRGDFEKRIKIIMEGISSEEDAILYIDEIHNVVGAGRTSDGGPDASNLLKPYLESDKIRFIGSTTYEEYNRHMTKSKGFLRRFQQIDILEPTTTETLQIVNGLLPTYEAFHHVTYTPEAVRFAVEASAKYITNRYLPDKAIDLIDEAGAYLESHHAEEGSREVTKTLVKDILTGICKINAEALIEKGNGTLQQLKQRMLAQIYGQDTAVNEVVNAVMMAKAGLTDDNKPLASLLFVGPTGVGKTEVARVLAKELGVELVRFDMSEYTEKHAVAKLIGSPAGYVGYEDGGQLTDAIRKTPNCVLLLDEIEKAHSDIYNILLQVMDYAQLTDNHGMKADFHNVILIMTSNAGAQYASLAAIGFNNHATRGEAMLQQVKKTFKPEFINRLTNTVVFHDMDLEMARLVLRKKVGELQTKLQAKNVTLSLRPRAEEELLREGFSAVYGAREMDRILSGKIKPLLMQEILFGDLQHGGMATVDYEENKFKYIG